jgi:hypothetical protein
MGSREDVSLGWHVRRWTRGKDGVRYRMWFEGEHKAQGLHVFLGENIGLKRE